MKKAVSMFLAAALAVGTFAGCGSSADTGSTGSAASTESGSTDSAADGSVFKIGGIGPTTGAAAIYGSAVMNAAQIAVDEINEAGGINGYQVEFKAEDDQSDAEKSVNAYNSLKDWGMQVLMGTVTTTPCIAVADKTAEDGMFERSHHPLLPQMSLKTTMYSRHALQTRIWEQLPHSTLVRTNLQQK